jgi:hypothetical protein
MLQWRNLFSRFSAGLSFGQAVDAAGLVDARLIKYSGTPCFAQHGIEMRETRLEAFTRPKSSTESLIRVMFKGPGWQFVDDAGTPFERGKVVTIAQSAWQRIAASTKSNSFVRLAESSSEPVACGTGRGG